MKDEANPLGRMMLLAGILGATALGFVVGTRAPSVDSWQEEKASELHPQAASLARSNEELATRPWSDELPAWQPSFATTANEPVTTGDAEAYARVIGERASLRAYDGAPPAIPHPIAQGGAQECRVCHDEGVLIAGVQAPLMSHPLYAMCTQCHAPIWQGLPIDEELGAAATVASVFEGFRGVHSALTMTEGAPPQLPHPSYMRENCQSCHGQRARPGLQTSHPDRQNCMQCHAPDAALNQQPITGGT